jgi:hypothetical protein
VAGRDAAGSLRFHWNDGNGTPAQLRPQLLLDGGEIGVEIEEKPANERCIRELHPFSIDE